MKHIWIRKEYKQDEKRVAITPNDARVLIENGLKITVEEHDDRFFPVEEYSKAGCDIVPGDSWQNAPSDVYVLGLKELPNVNSPLPGNHVYFAHAFKGQPGSDKLLKRFQQGGGNLYDLEYLTDQDGKRVAAFGFYAGICAVAVGIEIWCKAENGISPQKISQKYYSSFSYMLDHLEKHLKSVNAIPNILVIGPSGRCGKGAISLLDELKLPYTCLDREDRQDVELVQRCIEKSNIIINSVCAHKVGQEKLITKERLNRLANNTNIVDLACEPFSDNNLIDIYDEITTFASPVKAIECDGKNVFLSAIDHIPSYLPKESSEYFSSKLTPCILQYKDNICWLNAKSAFVKALEK
ncbi:MAG: saccharopine dehydrogenase [Gammaproteobacteria bacterium]|nr:saccharopine dehydrogenase [Gammaproteobacteria bacterium]